MSNHILRQSDHEAPSHRASKSGRPTIGFLVESSTGPSGFQDLVWKGFIEAANARDVNAIVLSGGWIGNVPADPYNITKNLVHGVISGERMDGLVIDWSIASYISPAEFAAFCKNLSPLPIVSVFGKVEGHTRIRADNKTGLRDLMRHLVKDHHYERIAFIKGWEGHTDAEERYAVYLETLEEHGIAFDPQMVYHGDFLEPSGRRAVDALLTERGKKIQAIVASNDAMALGALAALRRLGKNVPEEIAVTGFDDAEPAGTSFPPLTTVKQSIDEIGKAAIDVLLGVIDGKAGPDSVEVPVHLVIRESCGCSSAYVAEAGGAREPRLPAGAAAGPGRARAIAAALSEPASLQSITPDRETLAGVVDALIEDTENTRPGAFLSRLRALVYDLVQRDRDVFTLVRLVTGLKTHIPALWTDAEKIALAENKIAQAYIMIGETAKRVQESVRIEMDKKAKALREVGQALITTFDFDSLKGIVRTQLERLGIPSAFISLFRTVNAPNGGSNLFLAYSADSGMDAGEIANGHTRHALPPAALFPRDRRYACSVHPLCFKDLAFGYIMFELGPEDGVVYDALQVEIESALMGSELLQAQRRTDSEIREKTDTIQRLVRPMLDSIDGVTGTIKEKLGALSNLVNLTKENSVKLRTTNGSIDLIGKKIYNMSGIINIIENVSSSVHILAINTSIEATHAGDFGRGFSVIAKELGKLADSIRSNTEAVSSLIMGIRPDMEVSKKAGGASLEAFAHLEKDVLELADTLNRIAQSMEELSSSSAKILSVMNE